MLASAAMEEGPAVPVQVVAMVVGVARLVVMVMAAGLGVVAIKVAWVVAVVVAKVCSPSHRSRKIYFHSA